MLESKFSKRNLVIKNNSENVQKERKDKLVRNSSIKKEETVSQNNMNHSVKVKREVLYPEINEYLEDECRKSSKISDIISSLNSILGDLVFRKRSNQKEVENQQKIVKKKEDENENFNRQIENEIDKVLEKAKKTLNTIKDNKSGKNTTEEKKKTDNKETKSTNNNSNCLDQKSLMKEKVFYSKYNENIDINEDNMKTYFGKIAKFKQYYNGCKENLTKVKEHSNYRKLKDKFIQVYKINVSKIKAKNEQKEIIDLNSTFPNVNMVYKVGCIIFDQKLKDIFISHDYSENKEIYSENEIKKLFTFWFIVNRVHKILEDETSSMNDNPCKLKESVLTSQKQYFNSVKGVIFPENSLFQQIIYRNITNYLSIIFNISKDKSKISIEDKLNEINEENIFDSDFFELYNIMKKSVKIKLLVLGNDIMKCLEKSNLTKNEISFFKEFYAVVKNDSQYSFQVTQKLKKK